MDPSNKPQQKPDYRLEMIDGELLLYHPIQTKLLYCNQSASLVWELCDGQRTVGDIISLLSDAFPEAADTIPTDVEATLQQFYEHGAIDCVGEGPSAASRSGGKKKSG